MLNNTQGISSNNSESPKGEALNEYNCANF